MTTASLSFVAFSALVAALYSLWGNLWWRSALLFVANIAFLASLSTEPTAYLPLSLFLLTGYASVQLSSRTRSTSIFVVLLTLLVGGFCWLKKYWFISVIGFIDTPYITIGLSYIFFRVLQLVIDAKDDKSVAEIGVLDYLNYTLSFTSLIAGPIQSYRSFVGPVPALDLCIAGRAIERIIIGMFKVLVLSSILSSIQNEYTGNLLYNVDLSARVWCGILSISVYPVYLYFNFSGYMDIVIGISRFIGMILPENFDRPFFATNFIDFWARYHMTLSNWLKVYVYTPFLRVLMVRFPDPILDPYLGTAAFFLTFFLIGIWHGPTFIFALYGILLATGVSVNKLYQVFLIKKMGRKKFRQIGSNVIYRTLSRGLTFAWYSASMICFWASGDRAFDILTTLGLAGSVASFFGILLLSAVVLSVIEVLQNMSSRVVWNGLPIFSSRYTRTISSVFLIYVCVVSVILSENAAPDIVYKAF